MHFMPLKALTAQSKRFGVFFGTLIDLQARTDSRGFLFYRLIVSDGSSSIYCNVWTDSPLFEFVQTLSPCQLTKLEVKGQLFSLNNQLMCSVSDINVCNSSGSTLFDTYSVPIRARSALVWLDRYIQELPFPCLRQFLINVFQDPAIGADFLKCRASVNNHHNCPGGLLVHSVEVAKLVEANADILGIIDFQKHISIVAALLHDLGKIQTVGAVNPRPRSAALFRHEAQTLILVAQHLKDLAYSSKKTAELIEHLLGRMIACDKFNTAFIGEDLVRHADQASAAANVIKSVKTLKLK